MNYERTQLHSSGLDMNSRVFKLTPENCLRTQYEFATADPKTTKHPAIVGGFGSGKTRAIPMRWLHLINWRAKYQKQYCKMMIVEPTYEMIRDVLVPTMEKFFTEIGIPYTLHKTHNNFRIYYKKHYFTALLRSYMKPESLTGKNLSDFIIDEFDKTPLLENQKSIWLECVSRIRESEYGTGAIVTTPEGHRHTYELYQELYRDNPNFKIIRASTANNKFLPADYISNLYDQYDSLMVKRYIEGEFVSINGLQAYYAYNESHITDTANDDHVSPVWIGIDFNVNPMSACIAQPRRDNLGNVWVDVFDEFFIPNSNTTRLADAILQRYQGRELHACPDMTGAARHSSADYSDLQILQKKGFKIYGQGSLTEKTRLNITNNLLDKGAVRINPRCKNLIRGLETVMTNDYGQLDKAESGRKWTDITDAFTYVVIRCTRPTPRWTGY